MSMVKPSFFAAPAAPLIEIFNDWRAKNEKCKQWTGFYSSTKFK